MNNRKLKWYGQVKNGKMTIFAIKDFERYYKKFEGKKIVIELDLADKETTNLQYRYLYGHLLPLLAEYTGFDILEAEYIIKERWHSERRQIKDPTTGEVRIIYIPLSFARGNITRKKFAEIIDKTEALLIELGIEFGNIETWYQYTPEISYKN